MMEEPAHLNLSQNAPGVHDCFGPWVCAHNFLVLSPRLYFDGLGPQNWVQNHIFIVLVLSCWEHEDSVLIQTQPFSGLSL